jgi:hypothetical protein
MSQKFKFEDLQPHVDMLCDALENRGASSSGIPHDPFVMKNAQKYRDVLAQVRANTYSFDALLHDLSVLHHLMVHESENNQRHRIHKIVSALDIFILKEYNRITKSDQ